MDLDLVCDNAAAEARRLQLLILRAAKRRTRSPRQQIERGLAGQADPESNCLSAWVAARAAAEAAAANGATDAGFKESFRRLLNTALARRSELLSERRYVDALSRLASAWPHWLREPEPWAPRTHNLRRQFASLARHLLARYEVPALFDAVWMDDSEASADGRLWYAHVGRGENLRTAPRLPFPLTKMMAHHALRADADLSPMQALRWGQLVGAGASPPIARAAALTRLGRSACAEEPFWLGFAHLLANSPMADPRQVGPVVDYLFAQKFEPAPPAPLTGHVGDDGAFRQMGPPQPGLCLKGRTFQSLLRQVYAWHRQLSLSRVGPDDPGGIGAIWNPCGIRGLDRIEGEPGNQRRFVIGELLTAADLQAEGRTMRHCVASYVPSCARGRCAIFSMRADEGRGLERRMTIEVAPSQKTVVQARGRLNEKPGAVEMRILRAWAVQAGLEVRCG